MSAEKAVSLFGLQGPAGAAGAQGPAGLGRGVYSLPGTTAAWWAAAKPYYTLAGVNGEAGTARAMTLDRIEYTPFFVSKNCTLSDLAIHVTTLATAGGVARFGIYSADAVTFLPKNLLVAGAEVITTATLIKSVAAVLALTANTLYWQAIAFGVAAPSVQSHALRGVLGPTAIIGHNPANLVASNNGHIFVARAYAALPDPAVAPDSVDSTNPACIFARFSA